jgi:pyruvate/2-oxoglutarate/acetoin dehydrogenase E1 component
MEKKLKNIQTFEQHTDKNLNISDVRSSETIDARKIVINCLKMYNLTEVEEMNYQADLANEIINDLVNAGFMK